MRAITQRDYCWRPFPEKLQSASHQTTWNKRHIGSGHEHALVRRHEETGLKADEWSLASRAQIGNEPRLLKSG